jgi:hypothetical protein
LTTGFSFSFSFSFFLSCVCSALVLSEAILSDASSRPTSEPRHGDWIARGRG